MTAGDLERLHRACFITPEPWSAAAFQAVLTTPGTVLLETPDGFLLGRQAGPEMELLTLAVHPDARRQGQARDLLERFESRARESGAEEIFLEVAETNAAALALYRDAGYDDAGYRKDYYHGTRGEKTGALVMRKDLSTG